MFKGSKSSFFPAKENAEFFRPLQKSVISNEK